jgi:toluene monooxygenase system protein E
MVQQKTFWHLLAQRRMPSEYEIVTSKLLLNTEEGFTGKRFELDVPLRQWYERYQQGSPLVCSSWEKFRDPRETTYTKYTELQMEKEIFVDTILEEIDASGYDRELQPQWVQTLATLVAPFRYPGHALMMIAAYVAQMAPGGAYRGRWHIPGGRRSSSCGTLSLPCPAAPAGFPGLRG